MRVILAACRFRIVASYRAVSTVCGVEEIPWYAERLASRCCQIVWRRVVEIDILVMCPDSITNRMRYTYTTCLESIALSQEVHLIRR